MRKTYSKKIERARELTGAYGSNPGDAFGRFRFGKMCILAGIGRGWEHVSVSHRNRCPRWDEMCWVKDEFWGPDEWVMQYHPAVKDYVNNHPFCLHLWRPMDGKFPVPPAALV